MKLICICLLFKDRKSINICHSIMASKKKLKHYPQNVHGYEHHVKEIYKQCCLNDKTIYNTFDEVVKEVKNFLNDYKCNLQLKNEALSAIDMLIRDKGKTKNCDSTNHINIEILLPQIWSIIRSYDSSGKIIFVEQLADIMKGKCAQGRIIRLVQFYVIHHS